MTILQLLKIIKPWVWDPKIFMDYLRAAGINLTVCTLYFIIMKFVFNEVPAHSYWEEHESHFWCIIVISLIISVWVNHKIEKRNKNKGRI